MHSAISFSLLEQDLPCKLPTAGPWKAIWPSVAMHGKALLSVPCALGSQGGRHRQQCLPLHLCTNLVLFPGIRLIFGWYEAGNLSGIETGRKLVYDWYYLNSLPGSAIASGHTNIDTRCKPKCSTNNGSQCSVRYWAYTGRFFPGDLPVDGRKTILHSTLIVSSSECRFGSWKTWECMEMRGDSPKVHFMFYFHK
jgi:hypothetical protein